jgi:hypothetical protein
MKNMRLVLSVLFLGGASVYAQGTTNFFADFEGSTPGPVTTDGVMNDGTVLGGTWSSTNWNWDSSVSEIVTNASNAAFNFRGGAADGTSNHVVNIQMDAAIPFASQPVELSFLATISKKTNNKDLWMRAYDSSDTFVFGVKVAAVNSSKENYRTLQWVLESENLDTMPKSTMSHANEGNFSAPYADASLVKIVVDPDRAALYVDGQAYQFDLPYAAETTGATLEIARIEWEASKDQGLQLDDILIQTLPVGSTQTTNGTPIAYLEQYGSYINDFDAADAADDDGDGLNNGDEFLEGTRMDMASTDGDQYSDSVELSTGADPLVNDSLVYAAVSNNPAMYGWEDASSISNLSNGKTIVATVDGQVDLDIQLLENDNLVHGSFTNSGTSTQFQAPVPADKAYFRLH